VAGQRVADRCCERLNDVASELLLLSLIFDKQSLSILFGGIVPSYFPDVVHDPHKHFLRGLVPILALCNSIAHVSPCNVSCSIR